MVKRSRRVNRRTNRRTNRKTNRKTNRRSRTGRKIEKPEIFVKLV